MNQKNNRYWLARNFHAGNCNLFRNEPVKNGKTWTDPVGNENDFPKEGIPISGALLRKFGLRPVKYTEKPKVVYISAMEVSKERFEKEMIIINKVISESIRKECRNATQTDTK